ncbi:MAG: AzlC family ABC transporter permease [Treponema sp.]|nr:AzlC family ABC transporter permease [Treponema sp.]
MRNMKNRKVFSDALVYSMPVFLGYLAIGIAFGLLLVDADYPWWLALIMSICMYAGAGQYIAVGLFAAGVGLVESMLVQLAVNARHIVYGLSLSTKLSICGKLKYYVIFALTDETFALLSTLAEDDSYEQRGLFIFYVALLDQCYWVLGTAIGALIGSLLPFNMEGVGFALTALFITLTIEQILHVKKPKIFIISACIATAAVSVLSSGAALLASLMLSLGIVALIDKRGNKNDVGFKQ